MPNPSGPEAYLNEASGKHIKFLHILSGHSSQVSRIEFSRNGRYIGSASKDAVCVWDSVTGELVRRITGAESRGDFSWSPDGRSMAICSDAGIWVADVATGKPVWRSPGSDIRSVAWSPLGEVIATGATSGSIDILHDHNGAPQKQLLGHRGDVFELAWSHDGRFLASAGGSSSGKEYDQDIRVWDIRSGKAIARLQGHSAYVAGLAWSPDSMKLASVSMDTTVKIWDPVHNRLTHTIEVHTSETRGVAFSPDGHVLASNSWDGTLRFWDARDLKPLGGIRFREDKKGIWNRVAFAPDSKTMCACPNNEILVFRVNLQALTSGDVDLGSVRYTTAKLVLVGDSGVGKTGLGWRLSHSEFREHSSTHGQQFWIVDTLGIRREDGTECQAVLWDLAGQHVYRPVHVIFLEKVDVALVVFDPTNRQESFKGVEFWLDQLSLDSQIPPAVLVGGRLDRGAPVLSRQELEQFCQHRGISGGYIGTSARSGEGIGHLVDTLKRIIPWDNATATVTTETFKWIKDYILSLKEATGRESLLINSSQLQKELLAKDPERRFETNEMMTAVTHLENHGYVTVLTSSAGLRFILLQPTILPDLASSIVLQAEKHPRELGALSETRLLQDDYSFPDLAGVVWREREILLDATVVRLLHHNVCFRETLGDETLLIFPGLIKQKRPLHDEVETVDDVSYVVRGRVENLYAGLAVLLGYSPIFTRVTQWYSQAQYELEKGQVCGFRMYQERESELEFVIYYGMSTPAYGQKLFQGLFEKFLYERDVEVTRLIPVSCPNGHQQERATLTQRRREGKDFVFCGECGQRVVLTNVEAPPSLGTILSRQVQRQESLARLRSTYEANLARIKAYRRDRTAPRCYLSYTDDNVAWSDELLQSLRDAGVFVVRRLADLGAEDFILVGCTDMYWRAWAGSIGRVGNDAAEIRQRAASGNAGNVIPLLMEGVRNAAILTELGGKGYDFRDETRYVLALFDLILRLNSIPPDHRAFGPLRKAMYNEWQRAFSSISGEHFVADPKTARREVFISYSWNDESMEVVAELDRAFQNEGIYIVQDKRDLGFKGDIRQFMRSIGQGKCVVVVLSDSYLQSENCMFELLEVAKHGDFRNRVFPVVLKTARIYKPLDRLRYVQYWEAQIDDLDEALRTVSAANMQGFREEIDLYTEIRAALPRLAEVLKNVNALSLAIQRDSGYTALVEAVLERLEE